MFKSIATQALHLLANDHASGADAIQKAIAISWALDSAAGGFLNASTPTQEWKPFLAARAVIAGPNPGAYRSIKQSIKYAGRTDLDVRQMVSFLTEVCDVLDYDTLSVDSPNYAVVSRARKVIGSLEAAESLDGLVAVCWPRSYIGRPDLTTILVASAGDHKTMAAAMNANGIPANDVLLPLKDVDNQIFGLSHFGSSDADLFQADVVFWTDMFVPSQSIPFIY